MSPAAMDTTPAAMDTTPAAMDTTPTSQPAAVPPTAAPPPPLPRIIPPADSSGRRTLVLCFDGTGDQFDADNSNVIQLFTMLQKDNHSQQMVYYQAGIGTYTVPQIATPLWSRMSQSVDAAIAWNLHAHVMEGYVFLMQNYQAGDKICIFGFSRGAYTARSLAGMVHKVGLLPACNHQQVPFAYTMYQRCDEIGWKQSVAFKKAFSINVDIEFVGVWDTVCSVGLFPRTLPFVSSNTAIRYFRHAVSLDERRAKFKANLYNRPTEKEAKLGVQPGEMPTPTREPPPGTTGGIWDSVLSAKWAKATAGASDPDKTLTSETLRLFSELQESIERATDLAGKDDEVDKAKSAAANAKSATANAKNTPAKLVVQPKKQKSIDSDSDENDGRYESLYVEGDGDDCGDPNCVVPSPDSKRSDTDVLEVWFAGCHCDVGGGSVSNGTRHNLARIPLRWMIRQCFLANTGIRFHTSLLRQAGLDPASLYPIVKPRPQALYVSHLLTHAAAAATSDIHTTIPPTDDVPPTPLSATPLIPSRADGEHTLVNRADTKLPLAALLEKLEGKPGTLTEEEEDLADALCPVYDQLSIARSWWALELLPLKQVYQLPDREWVKSYTFNFGRGRDVPSPTLPETFNVHRTVDVRMQATGYVQSIDGRTEKAYVPKAQYKAKEHWVD